MLTLAMLFLLTFALSLWPLPYPYATVGNVLALISLSLAIWVAWRLVQNRAPLDYGRARRAYSQGDDETALSLLSAAEERSPDYYGILHLRAMIYRDQGEYGAAREVCQRLIDLHPDLYYGYADLGLTLLAERKPTEASIALGNAVQIAPFLPEGYLNLGMARVEAKEDERAIDALSRALRLGFRDDVAELMTRFYLLHALERLGDHTRAEIERRRLRHRRGTLKRWRAELEGDIRQATSQSKERALLSAIERAIEKSI
jgi:tetratricopeptide (TPR) repeat protein